MECHGMPWKISYKWRFLARKIIYKWAIFHGYVKLPEGMLNKYIYILYPLVNGDKKLWKNPPFFMGKLTINGHVQ